MLSKQFQRVRSAAVAAPVKAGARGQSQRFPAWGSDAHGAWSPSHSRVDEVKILGEAGIFTSRHTAFRARHRRAAVPISHTELWGRRRQDTTATNTQNTGASVTTRDSLHFKKIYYRIWLVYYFTPTNNPGNVFILTVLVYKISKHTGWWEESDPLHRRVCGRSLPHWIYADANHLSAKISPWLTFHPSGATLNRETSACRNAAHETDSSQNALWSACSSRVEG